MDCILRTFENCSLLIGFQHLAERYGKTDKGDTRTSLQGDLFVMGRGESVII